MFLLQFWGAVENCSDSTSIVMSSCWKSCYQDGIKLSTWQRVRLEVLFIELGLKVMFSQPYPVIQMARLGLCIFLGVVGSVMFSVRYTR